MNLRFGSHQIVLTRYPLRFLRRATPADAADMLDCLDHLARVLDGNFSWWLSGGLAIPTSLGEFYRRHADIDITVEGKDLPKLVERARLEGYMLFARPIVVRLGLMRRIDHYIAVTAAEVLTARWKSICLMRVREDGTIIPRERLHDSPDVYVYRIKNGTLVFHNGMRAPATSLHGVRFTTRSGRSIQVVDVRQVLEFKKFHFSMMDRCDKKMIVRYLSQGAAHSVSGEEAP